MCGNTMTFAPNPWDKKNGIRKHYILKMNRSPHLDDVLSQPAEFILRNLFQHVLTFQNTPGLNESKIKIFSPSKLK